MCVGTCTWVHTRKRGRMAHESVAESLTLCLSYAYLQCLIIISVLIYLYLSARLVE